MRFLKYISVEEVAETIAYKIGVNTNGEDKFAINYIFAEINSFGIFFENKYLKPTTPLWKTELLHMVSYYLSRLIVGYDYI